MGLDGYKHKRNLNVLVVGGSGAGKSRTYAIPNIMQCNCSMVITDPKAELLRKTGGVLERNGYEVRVFDLIIGKFCSSGGASCSKYSISVWDWTAISTNET